MKGGSMTRPFFDLDVDMLSKENNSYNALVLV